ncbi:MAG: DUF503 domain-containing protein [Calditrichia bacterium]
MKVIVGLMTLDLFLPVSGSLKEKRMVIKSLKDRIHNRYNVSIAEVDFLDKWQRSRLGIALVANDYSHIEKNMNAIFNYIESTGKAEIVDHSFEFL